MNRIVPFRLLPASWGLSGSLYDIAEAHYLYTGEDLERQLAKIEAGDDVTKLECLQFDIMCKYGHISAYERDVSKAKLTSEYNEQDKLSIDLKHGRISAYDYAVKIAKLTHEEGIELDISLLNIDLLHGKISKQKHDKDVATLKQEPWISIINDGYNPDEGINGFFFEFDWNIHWIDHLRLYGYTGRTDEDIVSAWFEDICMQRTTDGDQVSLV